MFHIRQLLWMIIFAILVLQLAVISKDESALINKNNIINNNTDNKNVALDLEILVKPQLINIEDIINNKEDNKNLTLFTLIDILPQYDKKRTITIIELTNNNNTVSIKDMDFITDLFFIFFLATFLVMLTYICVCCCIFSWHCCKNFSMKVIIRCIRCIYQFLWRRYMQQRRYRR